MDNLTLACELSLNAWLATFPDEIPEAERSKKHEKWKKKLFNQMRDDYYHRFTTKALKIMFVAAVLFALLLTAFVFPSSREFILDKFDKHSTYKLTDNNKNAVTGEIKIGYIPNGYELETNIILGKQISNTYYNGNENFFTIFKYSSSMEVNFDTENYESEEIVIDSVKYIYCQSNDGIDNLIWTKSDYVYKLDATFEKEELIKIAKTVE